MVESQPASTLSQADSTCTNRSVDIRQCSVMNNEYRSVVLHLGDNHKHYEPRSHVALALSSA
jgi:hypothetical protein